MVEDLSGIDKFIVAKVDRFGRDFAHSVALKDRLDEAGVDLVCLDPRIDFSTSVGVVVWANLTSVAQMERRNIGDRVSATSGLHRAAGKAAGGPRPYGYDRRPEGGLIVNREEAVIVRRMYGERAAGTKVMEICRGLDRDRIRTYTGARFAARTVARILRTPSIQGRWSTRARSSARAPTMRRLSIPTFGTGSAT